jgi:hypothetical protein
MTEDLLQRGRVNHTTDALASPAHLNLERAGPILFTAWQGFVGGHGTNVWNHVEIGY